MKDTDIINNQYSGINTQSVTGQSMTVFNVSNFGAVGDGIADDTLAIQKAVSQALNVRGSVYIPNGKYRITATINCIPVWGSDAGPGIAPNGGTLARAGCTIKGEHRTGTVIYADFDNWRTVNVNGQNVCQYYLTNGNLAKITESPDNGVTQLNLTDKIVFYHAEYMHFSDMWVIKKDTGTNASGIAFSTPYNTQTGWSTFERMTVELFDYGFWHRYTLYNTFKDLVLQNCRIGVRFARIDNRYPTTSNKNPIGTGGWNNAPNGWFHNVVHFDNCSIKGNSNPNSQSLISSGVTEIGFWGSPMAAVFTSCTFENIHRNTQATNNIIAPPGTPGTGIYIEDGMNNGSGKGITIHQFYTEVTERPIYCTDTRDVNINGGYIQGAYNNSSATSAAMEFNNCSSVNITGNIVLDGAFNNFIKATNNTGISYNNFTGGYSLSGNFSFDSTSRINQTSFTNYLTVSQLNTSLQNKANTSDVGDVTTLNTINKVAVSAINEINQNLSNATQQIGNKANASDIGTVSNLNTLNKVVVNAINEINQNLSSATQQIGNKANASDIGTVLNLNTSNKVVVNAVNEINQNLDSVKQQMGRVNTNIQILSPQSKWYGKKIVCLGDSITYGFSSINNNRLINPWVTQLKGILNLSSVVNYGINGSTVATSSSNSNWNGTQNPMCLRYSNMDSDADIVCCLGGINDFLLGVPLGNLNSTSTDTFYGALNTLYLGLVQKYPSSAIFIMTCNKVASSMSNPQGLTLSQWTDAQRQVAQYYSIPILDLYYSSNINPNISNQKTLLMPDGINPSQAGADILARKISGFIETL